MWRATLLCAVLLSTSPFDAPAGAQAPMELEPDYVARIHQLPPLRERAQIVHQWTLARVERVLPELMERHGVDLWILSMREYAEDPLFKVLRAPTTFAARRRSIYVFHRGSEGTQRYALGGGAQGGLYTVFNDPSATVEGGEFFGDGQWASLFSLVEKLDPKTIALNIDPHIAFADGLHAGEREALESALGAKYRPRIVRRPKLAVEMFETRLPEMMPRYRDLMETVHALISTAFSSAVIEPGVTSTDDLRWWLRQQVETLDLDVWFHPSVERASANDQGEGWTGGIIERGDALWVDFGVIGLGLHTDTQHLGYVLRQGETAAPAGLQRCLETTHRLQDLLLAEMVPGRTGDQALAATREAMKASGINGTIYSHPIGDHGHGAGPLIGLWDHQEGVPHRGAFEIRPSTWFSIELQATSPIPEWDDQLLSCRQEEEAYLDDAGNRHWVFRRQARFWLVR